MFSTQLACAEPRSALSASASAPPQAPHPVASDADLLPLSDSLAAQLAEDPAPEIAPPPTPAQQPWLGEYRHPQSGRTIMVVERAGELQLLLDANTAVRLHLAEAAPGGAPQATYQRDGEGAGESASVSLQGDELLLGSASRSSSGRLVFQRVPFAATTGEVFRIELQAPIDELRRRALAAQPPPELTQSARERVELVELVHVIPDLELDIRYASTDNFMEAVFYEQPRAFLQHPAADALAAAQAELREHGYGLLIYDAYRPWHVTKMFWDATPEHQREFVADPASGSRHNRGCAVDLTLIDLATGQPVDMPSGYDEFSHRAYANYPAWSSRARDLRQLLRHTLEQQGFEALANEWWHFDFASWREYPILNLRFTDL